MVGQIAADALDGHVVDALLVQQPLGQLRAGQAAACGNAGVFACHAVHSALRPQGHQQAGDQYDVCRIHIKH